MTDDLAVRLRAAELPATDGPTWPHDGAVGVAQAGAPVGTGLAQRPSPPVEACVRFIAGHFGEDIMLQDMADAVALNRERLARRFRRELGIAPVAFLHAHRAARAMGLLTGTDRPVPEIALTVGYRRVTAFSRSFRRVTGMYPQVHRRINARACSVCGLHGAVAAFPERPAAAGRGTWSYTRVEVLRYTEERPEAADGAIVRQGVNAQRG